MRSRYIYKITCSINDRFYIGQSYDVQNRFRHHMKGADTNEKMFADVNKFSAKKFNAEILFKLIPGEKKTDDNHYLINIIERSYIDYYTINYPELIYNPNDRCCWIPCSDGRRNKMSAALTGRKFTDETKQKISKAKTGKKFTDEWKKNMSIAQKKRRINE